MEMANRQLCENNKEKMFVTVFFGVLDIRTGEFSYVSGGHNPPLIGRRNAGGMAWDYIQIKKVGLVLGARKKTTFSMERLQETMNRVGWATASVREILADVRTDIDVHADGAEQSDDITMLGVRFLGRTAAEQ